MSGSCKGIQGLTKEFQVPAGFRAVPIDFEEVSGSLGVLKSVSGGFNPK